MKRKATSESTALPSSIISEKKARKVSSKENVEPVDNAINPAIPGKKVNKIDAVPDVADLAFEDGDTEALSLFNTLDFDLEDANLNTAGREEFSGVTQHVLRKEAEHVTASRPNNNPGDKDDVDLDESSDEGDESDSGSSESSNDAGVDEANR